MPNNSSIFLTLLVSLLFGICTSLTGKALMPARHQATYEAFGTRTAEQGSNTGRQRANTKEEDPTGLLNEGQRYRDLDAGVFISRDPAGFVDGPNVYAYVRQNPWTSFDPEGLSAWSDFTGFWGGVGEHAWGAAKGVGQLAMNLDPGMNTWQSISGNKTGYQKQFEGAKQAYNGYVASAENLGANSTLQDRNSVALVLDAAANYVDVAIKDPKKAGGLAFDAVTTLATGAEAGMALYSRSAGLGAAGSKSARAVNFETVIELDQILIKATDGAGKQLGGIAAKYNSEAQSLFVDFVGVTEKGKGIGTELYRRTLDAAGNVKTVLGRAELDNALAIKKGGIDAAPRTKILDKISDDWTHTFDESTKIMESTRK